MGLTEYGLRIGHITVRLVTRGFLCFWRSCQELMLVLVLMLMALGRTPYSVLRTP